MDNAITCVTTHLPQLLASGEPLTYRGDQILYYSGHAPAGLFCLQTGRVTFQPQHAAQTTYPPRHDDLLGLYHLIAAVPYETTCIANGDVEVIFVSKVCVSTLLDQHGVLETSGRTECSSA
jgi:hypothetical protein